MAKLSIAQLVTVLTSGVKGIRVKADDEKTILIETSVGTISMLNEIVWDFVPKAVSQVEPVPGVLRVDSVGTVPFSC